jgi:hypothetical protein
LTIQKTTPDWGAIISDGTYNNPCIEIMTEIGFSNGMRIRCHPDYPTSGAWYDWVMVKWEIQAGDMSIRHSRPSPHTWRWSENKRRKFVRGNNQSTSNYLDDIRLSKLAGGSKYFNEIVTDLNKHIDTDEYEPIVPGDLDPEEEMVIYTPAKVLALFQMQDGTQEMCALIHSCMSNSKTNTFLSREWELEYTMPTRAGEASKPRHHIVALTSIECPCYVVEECPGVFESRPASTFVHEIFDRKSHWSMAFLEICKVGISNFEAVDPTKNKATRTHFAAPIVKEHGRKSRFIAPVAIKHSSKPAAKKKK